MVHLYRIECQTGGVFSVMVSMEWWTIMQWSGHRPETARWRELPVAFSTEPAARLYLAKLRARWPHRTFKLRRVTP